MSDRENRSHVSIEVCPIVEIGDTGVYPSGKYVRLGKLESCELGIYPIVEIQVT